MAAFHDKLATRVIHAGQSPDPSTGAIMTPIYTTSTYVQKSPGDHLGYEYSRTHNPTRKAWEGCIADLEGGSHGFAFASGMAAVDTVMHLLAPGDHVLAMNDLYGGTWREPTIACWWSTTPSPRPCSSGRSRWAPISWCTRSPSTSTAIPIWSAARWWSTVKTSAKRSGSSRTRPARCRARSMHSW